MMSRASFMCCDRWWCVHEGGTQHDHLICCWIKRAAALGHNTGARGAKNAEGSRGAMVGGGMGGGLMPVTRQEVQ
jgi:hypothetical protein